jgi:predicted membrane channel-forming protein YqfA (hemolysin III family)
MVKVLGIVVVTFFIAVKEILPLKKQKKTKEIWIFSIFQLSATTLLSLIVLNVKIPSPLEVIRVIYKPISDMLFSILS